LKTHLSFAAIAAGFFTCSALCQESPHNPFAPMFYSDVAVKADSGFQRGDDLGERIAWYTLVQSPGAPWIRVQFGADTALAKSHDGGDDESFLRITSLADGDEQILNTESLAQWQGISAYFNGDAVMVELVCGAHTDQSRVDINGVQVGADTVVMKSQCGLVDDRVAVSDNRVARIVPVGCTGWMINNDANHMFLSAGHCPAAGNFTTLHFNVPLSSSSGSTVAPPVADQYAIDQTSVQYTSGGLGNDYAYFGAFPNSNTGLTPYQKYQAAFDVVLPPSSATGNTIRITGFGTDAGTASQTNQTHSGPMSSISGTTLYYSVDTEGGNSGSPVIWENQGTAIGIHTNGGCSSAGGSNSGTGWSQSNVRNAVAAPKGACQSITFTPSTLPTRFASAGGDVLSVTVTSPVGASAATAVKMLWRREGESAWSSITGTLVSGSTYNFITPPLTCGTRVQYAFSARMGASGGLCTYPAAMPRNWLTANVSVTNLILWEDTFETARGWSISGTATAGAFERALPRGNGFQGDPTVDADGSGVCVITGRNAGVNVDGGTTIYTSPAIDARGGLNTQISYARWFNCATGTNANQDTMRVEISGDNGANWVELETVGPTGTASGWVRQNFSIADYVQVSSQVMLRFSTSDASPASVVEAGIDSVRVLADTGLGWCGKEGDFDQDGVVGVGDISILFLQFGEPGITDLDGDGETTSGDAALLLLMFD